MTPSNPRCKPWSTRMTTGCTSFLPQGSRTSDRKTTPDSPPPEVSQSLRDAIVPGLPLLVGEMLLQDLGQLTRRQLDQLSVRDSGDGPVALGVPGKGGGGDQEQ